MAIDSKIQSEQSPTAEPNSAEQFANDPANTISPSEIVEPSHQVTSNEALNTELEPTIADTTSATNTPAETTNPEANATAISEVEVIPTDVSPSVEELKRQLAEVTKKAENYWDTLLRNQAEHDNLQKRMTRDLDNARKYALEKFATELLAIKDSLELGLEAAAKPETNLDTVREGMALTTKMLTDIMAKFNILEINPQNQKFDPQWHEAIAMQPIPNIAAGIVLHVQQKGYQLNDRLLRPARVVVAKTLETEKSLENQG
jgi:molecular chaperone GrpE